MKGKPCEVRPAPKKHSGREGGSAAICNEGAQNLRKAILRRAVMDYRSALKSRRCGKPSPFDLGELEAFFCSDFGQMLAEGQGGDILSRVRQLAEEDVVLLRVDCSKLRQEQRRGLAEAVDAFLADSYPAARLVEGGNSLGRTADVCQNRD